MTLVDQMFRISAMSTEGEREPLPAGPINAVLEAARWVTGSRPRIAVACTVVGVAAVGAWVVSGPDVGELVPGLGNASAKPFDTAPPAGPAAQTLADVDRYFPPQHVIEDGAFKARRTAGRQGTDCGEVLQSTSRDALKGAGCQGYLAVSYTRQDQQVLTSVTVLRFADEQSAAKARQAIANVVAFVQPDGVPEPPATAKPLTVSTATAEGSYVTVVASRFADLRPDGKPDPDLSEANRAVGYTARMPFIWM